MRTLLSYAGATALLILLAACSSNFPPPTGPVRVWKPGEVMKVAVFPLESVEGLGESDGFVQSIAAGLDEVPDTVVSHTAYPNLMAGASLGDTASIGRQSVIGARRVPNVPYLRSKGREWGVDAVLLISLRWTGLKGWATAVDSGRTVEMQPAWQTVHMVPEQIRTVTRELLLRTRAGN